MIVYPRALWRIVVALALSYLLIKTPEVAAPAWYCAGLFVLALLANFTEVER